MVFPYLYIYITLATREGSGETTQLRSLIRDCTGCAHNNGSDQRRSSDKAYIFLVDMITKPKFSNCRNIFKIGLFR